MYVSGGGSLGPGVTEHLAAGLGKKILSWEFAKKIETAAGADGKLFDDHKTLFNIALGLGLRT